MLLDIKVSYLAKVKQNVWSSLREISVEIVLCEIESTSGFHCQSNTYPWKAF